MYKKPEKKKLKNFPAGYVGKFYKNLVNNVDTFLGSDFYGRITNDVDILTTSNFTKDMQTDINHYVTKYRLNNTSFRQKLHPISKNILRRQNPLELVFEGISTFDAENPMFTSLLRELGIR